VSGWDCFHLSGEEQLSVLQLVPLFAVQLVLAIAGLLVRLFLQRSWNTETAPFTN